MQPHDAKEYLTRRYNDQCNRWPTMRNEITLEVYLAANMKYLVHSRYYLDLNHRAWR